MEKRTKWRTERQAAILREHGYYDNVSRASAYLTIKKIAERGWKTDIKPGDPNMVLIEAEEKSRMIQDEWADIGRLA